jgi:biotin carboxyl carrier protein
MAWRSWFFWLKWPAFLLVLGGLLAAAYTINSWTARERAEGEAKTDQPTRAANGVIKLGKELAESHGIEAEPARAVVWNPRVTVYGRVVPNPQATVEVRSPFAGTVRADTENAWPSPGRWIRAGQMLGRVLVRAGPQERLDIQAKLTEARAKQDGAEEVLKIQQERLDRLVKQPGVETLIRQDLDNARVLVAEARTQVATATAAAELYQKALAILDKHSEHLTSPWIELLTAAADGEVTEMAARPGMSIEAGGLIIRLVDFRRPLVRLELPPEVLATGPPPAHVELFAVPPVSQPLGSSQPSELSAPAVPATLLGPAGQVDAVSQSAGYWYEVGSPGSDQAHAGKQEANGMTPGGQAWRPGLFVRAHLQVSEAKPRPAVAVPRTALLFHQGRTLIYVRVGPGRFERREVSVLGRDGERWVLGTGVAAGEAVVCRQAQVLLSEEFKPQGEMDND